eukprot:5015683-Alexandrium_andersonii.AAC.1
MCIRDSNEQPDTCEHGDTQHRGGSPTQRGKICMGSAHDAVGDHGSNLRGAPPGNRAALEEPRRRGRTACS